MEQKFPVAVNETSSSSLLPLGRQLVQSKPVPFLGPHVYGIAHFIAIYWDFARFTLHEAPQRGNHGSNKLHSWLYMGKKYSRLSGRQIFWTQDARISQWLVGKLKAGCL